MYMIAYLKACAAFACSAHGGQNIIEEFMDTDIKHASKSLMKAEEFTQTHSTYS